MNLKEELKELAFYLQNDSVKMEVASKFMNRPEVHEFVSDVIERFDYGTVVLEADDLDIVRYIVQIAYYIYTYSAEDTGITDTEYDKLYDLLSKNGEEEFVSLEHKSSNEEEHHRYKELRGTLKKVHYLEDKESKVNKSRKTLDSWVKSAEKLYLEKTGKKIDLYEEEVYVFPKWDGVSAIFEFNADGTVDRVLTRGYTKFNTAKNVSQHFKNVVRPLDPKRPYGLKTEILVSEKSLNEYNKKYRKDYKQSRAIASGIVNSDESDERDSYLTIMQLRYMDENDQIEKLAPQVFDHPYIKCKLKEIDKIEAFAEAHHFTEGLRCDGAVIYIIDPEIQKVLGRKNDKNEFEVAYKFTEEYAYTTLKDITFQVGLFGRIAPVAKFEPVKLKGNKISSASIGSIDIFENLALSKGDEIKILYDIIPYITVDSHCNTSGKKLITLPHDCPVCGEPLLRDGSILRCGNINCNWRKKGKILNYFVKMNIKNISFATVDSLYTRGLLCSIQDIYRLYKFKDVITDIPGFGKRTYDMIIDEIDKNKRVSESLLLGSIGIEGIAETTFEKIFNVFTMDELLKIVKKEDYEKLSESIEGIGEKKAKQILKGIEDNKELILFLLDELEVIHESDKASFEVCFTKIRDENLEKLIKEKGGKTTNSVTKTTTYLVVPDKSINSGKTEKAAKYGTKIVTIPELIKILN